jgi:hypothetical protein
MIGDSLESADRLSVSLPLGCDPTGCGFKDPRTHKRHLVSLFRYPVFREPVLFGLPHSLSALGPSRSGWLQRLRAAAVPSGEAGCTRRHLVSQAYFRRTFDFRSRGLHSPVWGGSAPTGVDRVGPASTGRIMVLRPNSRSREILRGAAQPGAGVEWDLSSLLCRAGVRCCGHFGRRFRLPGAFSIGSSLPSARACRAIASIQAMTFSSAGITWWW